MQSHSSCLQLLTAPELEASQASGFPRKWWGELLVFQRTKLSPPKHKAGVGMAGLLGPGLLPELLAHGLALEGFHVEIVGPSRHDEEGNDRLLTAVHLGRGKGVRWGRRSGSPGRRLRSPTLFHPSRPLWPCHAPSCQGGLKLPSPRGPWSAFWVLTLPLHTWVFLLPPPHPVVS